MIGDDHSVRVYLACGATDMRKSIDGLAAIVTYSFELDPLDTSLFVFCNKDCDRLKILRWDTNGFWLYYRRLERGRFRWPAAPVGQTLAITRRQLSWLLDGLAIEQSRAHKPVEARIAA
jgi:transposase